MSAAESGTPRLVMNGVHVTVLPNSRRQRRFPSTGPTPRTRPDTAGIDSTRGRAATFRRGWTSERTTTAAKPAGYLPPSRD